MGCVHPGTLLVALVGISRLRSISHLFLIFISQHLSCRTSFIPPVRAAMGRFDARGNVPAYACLNTKKKGVPCMPRGCIRAGWLTQEPLIMSNDRKHAASGKRVVPVVQITDPLRSTQPPVSNDWHSIVLQAELETGGGRHGLDVVCFFLAPPPNPHCRSLAVGVTQAPRHAKLSAPLHGPRGSSLPFRAHLFPPPGMNTLTNIVRNSPS
ncbi:hypothetical protein LY76DRAFT_14993 [Colletotrichum caudatum]|nr:hypothetical protein LY76DRAFT_14993 [Colletotrichum caudatum]